MSGTFCFKLPICVCFRYLSRVHYHRLRTAGSMCRNLDDMIDAKGVFPKGQRRASAPSSPAVDPASPRDPELGGGPEGSAGKGEEETDKMIDLASPDPQDYVHSHHNMDGQSEEVTAFHRGSKDGEKELGKEEVTAFHRDSKDGEKDLKKETPYY
jgi:hypothetical protein